MVKRLIIRYQHALIGAILGFTIPFAFEIVYGIEKIFDPFVRIIVLPAGALLIFLFGKSLVLRGQETLLYYSMVLAPFIYAIIGSVSGFFIYRKKIRAPIKPKRHKRLALSKRKSLA